MAILGSFADEDFWLVAGEAAEGTLFTSFRDPSGHPGAAAILERARARHRADLLSAVPLWRGAGLRGVLTFGFLGVFLVPTLLAIGYVLVQEWSVVPSTVPALPPARS